MNWMRSKEDKQYPEPDIMKNKEGLLALNRKVERYKCQCKKYLQ